METYTSIDEDGEWSDERKPMTLWEWSQIFDSRHVDEPHSSANTQTRERMTAK